MSGFFDGDGKRALAAAIPTFERNTAAELVITVRSRSDPYWHVSVLVGAVAALTVLALLLYSEPEFDLPLFLVYPALVGPTLGAAARWPLVQRALTPTALRERRVLAAARATFVEHGVADTRGRTGVLLYISLAERTAVVIPDLAVRRAMPPEAWARAVLGLRDLLARGAPATALLAPISALGDLCGEVLPRADDDRNELPDAVQS
jgi:putative membrane protein